MAYPCVGCSFALLGLVETYCLRSHRELQGYDLELAGRSDIHLIAEKLVVLDRRLHDVCLNYSDS